MVIFLLDADFVRMHSHCSYKRRSEAREEELPGALGAQPRGLKACATADALMLLTRRGGPNILGERETKLMVPSWQPSNCATEKTRAGGG